MPKQPYSQILPIEPSHEAIAARAYELWEQRGRRPGQAEETWYDAERELQAAAPPDYTDPIVGDLEFASVPVPASGGG